MPNVVIGIEGLSDTGKTTLANTVCKKVNGVLLDTGILYRIIACCIKELNLDTEELIEKPIEQILDQLEIFYDYKKFEFVFPYAKNLNGIEVTNIATRIGIQTKTKYYPLFFRIINTIIREKNVVLVGRNVSLMYNLNFHFYLIGSKEKRAQILLSKNKELDYEKAIKIVTQRETLEREGFHELEKGNPTIVDVSNYGKNEIFSCVYSMVQSHII